MKESERFMQRAIELSIESVKLGGGPFGATIVMNNQIVGEGQNRVTIDFDPTAHAEVVAIRNACSSLKEFHLKNAVLYTSCEPCPLCLSAAYWAHVENIFYGNDRADAAKIGFDDQLIYDEIPLPIDQRKISMKQLMQESASKAFEDWQAFSGRTEY